MKKVFILGKNCRLGFPAQRKVRRLDGKRISLLRHCCTLYSNDPKKKAAFTLAEVLITLGIIGVVAAMTLPAFLTNVQDRIKEKRIENIKQKLSKSTDKMLALSGVMGYGSTMDYVTELKKHYNIVKVCDNSNLRSCWPYDSVTLENGKEWDISKTKTGKTLWMKDGDGEEWDDTVGIVTNDGTNMILSYNKKCSVTADKLPTWGEDKATSSSTNCIAAVYDWNGGSKPNKFTDDVIAFNAGGLGTSCTIEIDGACFGAPFTPEPVTKAKCQEMVASGNYRIKACGFDKDYWAGAVKQCGGVDKMPTEAQLIKLAQKLYNDTSIGSGKSGLTLDTSATLSMGLTDSSFYLWSGRQESDGYNACLRYFGSTVTFGYCSGRGDNYQAVCLE